MQNHKIVLISGKQGSGKTTLQKALALAIFHGRLPNTRVFQMNFADILYEMHDTILNILKKYIPPRNIVKDGPLLQLLGTEWGRKTIHENIWVDCLKGKIKNQLELSGNLFPNYVFIIGDCRFENEFDGFPDALRIRLECGETTRKIRCSMWRENTFHPSETGLDVYSSFNKFDLTFNTEIESTESMVELILAKLQKGEWHEKR